MQSFQPPVRVLVDFDGTIVPGDVTDHIMLSFADERWQALETEFQAGRMNSRACMAAQVDLIRATPKDIERAVGERTIDPDFPAFVAECKRRGIQVTVVSDGFDLAIKMMLGRYGLDLPFYANHLEWLGDDRWRLGFPHRNIDCRTEAGNCKCRQLATGGMRTVMIGDGRSDFCAASRADFVLSKASLTDHCRRTGIHHWAINGFDDVMARFDGWLAEATAPKAPHERAMSPARRMQASKVDLTEHPALTG